MTVDLRLPEIGAKACFDDLYSELALYQAVLRVYTKPLFSWRKALNMSHDGRTLYEFARHTSQNVERLHTALRSAQFHFREGIELHYNFNGKHRAIYLFPWEERIVDLLLYRMLNQSFHSVFSDHSYAYRHRGFGVDLCQQHIRYRLRGSDAPVYFMKRDIADYFPSVDHDILLEQVAQWIEPEDYLYQLLRQRVRFLFRNGGGLRVAERGLPFGNATACFLANVHLTPLDRAMSAIPGLNYYRYADDFLAFSTRRDAVLEADALLAQTLSELKLSSKPKHHLDFQFARGGPTEDTVFAPVQKFRHLGLEHCDDSMVRLSRDKGRKLRNLFRFAFRRGRRKLNRLSDPVRRAELLVDISRGVVEEKFRSVALIDYYLKHVDDEEQLRLLDRWLAEEVLARALQKGHRKGNFGQLSFRRLREMGLPSLRHRRRLLRHGQLQSSFFVLRTEKLIEQERRRLSGRRGFSPVSRSSGQEHLVGKGAAC